MFRYVKLLVRDTPEGDLFIKVHKKNLYRPLTWIMDDSQIPEFCYKLRMFINKRAEQGKGCTNLIYNLIDKLYLDDNFMNELNKCTDTFGNVDFETLLSN